jgi:hypothetical protein
VAPTAIAGGAYLSDPSRALTARRTKLRTLLIDTAQMRELEFLSSAVLGTTAVPADADDLSDDYEDVDA